MIIHVGLVIVLLISQIATAVKGENSYLLDFSAIEADEREQQEAEFKESISDRLDELIAAAPAIAQAMRQAGGDETVRNIAVDAHIENNVIIIVMVRCIGGLDTSMRIRRGGQSAMNAI